MDDHKILVTGDYWHEDFRDVLSQMKVPTTLVALESLQEREPSAENYQAVLLAQSRPDQFSHADLEFLQAKFPNTPIVSLVGSWCEGELRSGDPAGGGVRIFWHQWQGRYENFANEFNRSQVTNWHLPKTANDVDRVSETVLHLAAHDDGLNNNSTHVGISAWTRDGYEMIADALNAFDFRCSWLESHKTESGTPDVICVNGNSLSTNLRDNVVHLRKVAPGAPVVAVLNFPRKIEVEEARDLGVVEIVSKPYQLVDLKFAIERVMIASKETAMQAAG